MSRIDELIKKLCPNGVEYKKIGEIFNIITDYTAAGSFADIAKNVKYIKSKDYAQLIRTTDIKSNFADSNNFVYVDENAFNYLWRVNINEDSIIMPNVGNCGEVYYIKPEELPNEYNVLGPNAILLKAKGYNLKYLYYCIDTISFKRKLEKITSTTGQTKFNKTNLKELQLPVPPLEVQCEIVHILDNFTLLSAELSAELKARQKQYEYYRDNLFENDNNVKLYSLKDLCLSIKDGMHNLPKNTLDKTEYPILSAQNINDGKINNEGKRYVNEETYLKENKRTNIEKGDVLLTIVATIGRTAVVEENNKFLLQRSVCVLKPKDIVNPYYLKFYLDTYKVQNYMITNAHGSAQAGLYLNQVAEILVPVPSIEKQNKIVKILTNFDRITNDISEGLPAEIEARKKQYEFYRDKLLTFKEKVK